MSTSTETTEEILAHFVFSGPDPNDFTEAEQQFTLEHDSSHWFDGLDVQEAYADLVDHVGSQLLAQRYLSAALEAAVRNDRVDAFRFLLENCASTVGIIELATRNKNRDIISLLFDRYDINEPLSWCVAPPLILAVNDQELTEWFLAHGADPNATSMIDETSLSAAVNHAPLSVIRMLFDHGGSIEAGQLLHYAISRKLPDYPQIVDFMLNKGCLINDVQYQNHLQSYYLQMALGLGTPLHTAIYHGRLDVVKALIAKGANPWIKDSRGMSCDAMAEVSEWTEVAAYLNNVAKQVPPPNTQFTEGRQY